MSEALCSFGILLVPKFKGLFRLVGHGELKNPLRNLFFAMLGLAFAWAIYAGAAWFLRHVMEVELVGALLPRKLMSLVLLILLSILLLSTTISSFSVFFLSEDLGLLLSTPVPFGSLYYARFVEMVVYSSWMVLFFGLPVFLAYGTAYRAPAGYYGMLAAMFPAVILIPGALGAMIAFVLTRLLSARRSRDLLIVLVVLAFVFLYLLLRTMRPERLLDAESFGTMVQFLDMFRAPESVFLPSQWVTESLFPLLEGRASPPLAALAVGSSAAALCALSGWLGTALYRSAYDRAQTGRVRSRPGRTDGRWLGGWLDRLGRLFGPLSGPLLVKDLRTFLRDANQWLQLLLLGALAAVYLLNFAYLKLAQFSWFTLFTVNHAMIGLVLAGVAVRFVFPAVSLEGRAWWIIRSAPVALPAFLHSKLLIHFAPLAVLGLILTVASDLVIGVPLVFGVISVALTLSLALAVACLGVGIGAIFPRFTAESPAKIPTGVGGVTYMIASMSFVLVFLLSSFYPTWVLAQAAQRSSFEFVRLRWLLSSLGAVVLLLLGATWGPMVLGERCLRRRED